MFFSDDLGGYNSTFILYNPSIRKSVKLPRPNVTFCTHGPHYYGMGFGFDRKSNDYKVVKLLYVQDYYGNDKLPPVVELFSLNEGVWRDIKGTSPSCYLVEIYWTQAFMNGLIHWVATDRHCKGRKFLLSFDVSNETFSEMEMPQSLVSDSILPLTVVKLGEWLSVVHYESSSLFSGTSRSCSVWIMKQYGVAESWTKLCAIKLPYQVDRVVGLMRSDQLLLAKQFNGHAFDFRLDDMSELALYHPESGKIKELGISSVCGSFYLAAYIESLALLGFKSAEADSLIEGGKEEVELAEEKMMKLMMMMGANVHVLQGEEEDDDDDNGDDDM